MNLKIERIKRNWNQSQLADKADVGLSTVARIEKHGIEKVSVSILRKLAIALDMSVAELFFSEE